MAAAAEYHVSVEGDDAHDGSARRPLRTIQRAAELAPQWSTASDEQIGLIGSIPARTAPG